jgi:purine-nucleoside phosphorylase
MTPHIEAKKGEIAKTVIMPGDPLRAKLIAERYLDNARLVTGVRNVLGYTGTYKGKEVTVMASGMGTASMGIYSYELYHFYDVENIIRIGSAGSASESLDVYNLLLVDSSYSDSSYARVMSGITDNIIYPSSELNDRIINKAKELNQELKLGRVYCTEVFYKDNTLKVCNENNCQAVEMETFALFHNANVLGKKASAVITISDSLINGKSLSSEDRQNSFTNMMLLVLESI